MLNKPRKFKLIKEYPGSLPINSEIIENGFNSWSIIGKLGKIINGLKPEDYPEFWKEITDKEYQILELISDLGLENNVLLKYNNEEKCIYRSDDNPPEDTIPLSKLINLSSNIKIHKIKRLSDGEIFTIGDKIKFYDDYPGKIYKIKGFSLNEYSKKGEERVIPWVIIDENEDIGGGLDTIIESNYSHILTSEEGFPIYEGETMYYVYPDGGEFFVDGYKGKPFKVYTDKAMILEQENVSYSSVCKFFKYKENAEKWAKANKPKWSDMDMVDFADYYSNHLVRKLPTFLNIPEKGIDDVLENYKKQL